MGAYYFRIRADRINFSSMADADWGWGFGPNLKRGPTFRLKRFRDFGSMADADWGWGFGHRMMKRDQQKSKRFLTLKQPIVKYVP